MVRKLLTSALLVATLSQVVSYAYFELLYILNQHEIASSQCERKVPHCNGHCFLHKQIAKDQAQNNSRETTKQKLETVQFFETQSDILPPVTYCTVANYVADMRKPTPSFHALSTPPPRA